jgi:MFS family permease
MVTKCFDEVEPAIRFSSNWRHQLWIFSVIITGMLSGAFFLYSLPYFQKKPDFECLIGAEWQSCSKDDACTSDSDFRTSTQSLENWVTQMDLFCASETQIGLLGSSFIGGCFFGSFILPHQADIHGRKPLFLIGLLIHTAVVLLSLFCYSLTEAYVLLFLGGIGETGRYYVAYVYMIEFFPSN